MSHNSADHGALSEIRLWSFDEQSNVFSIHGRLATIFGGSPFNPDGRYMLYMPGNRPKCNADDPWDLCVYDLEARENRVTLTGHTDTITSANYNHSGRFIGSASWDGTFRIWDAATGHKLHVFKPESGGQGWTASFSPAGELFAGANGKGIVQVWALKSGETIASFDLGKRWCRTLDWSPDGSKLAIGARDCGKVFVVDARNKAVIQERGLGMEGCPERHRWILGKMLEAREMRYFAKGKRIAWATRGHRAVEIYDFERNLKWKFAPRREEDWTGEIRFVVLEQDGKEVLVIVAGDVMRVYNIE